MSHQLHIFRIGADNAGCLLRCDATGRVATIDAGEAEPVLAEARRLGWTITDVLITHEHGDHIAGVAGVKAATGAQVSGPAAAGAAPLDRIMREGDVARIGEIAFEVWETPGHAPGTSPMWRRRRSSPLSETCCSSWAADASLAAKPKRRSCGRP